MKKRIFWLLLVGLLTVTMKVNAYAACSDGIRNNGTGGIWIDINKAPYTSNWSYGDPYGTGGCTWFVGSRVMQLTGKGNYNTQKGDTWYDWYGESLGFSKGSEVKAPAIVCWSGHVAILEKIEGDTAYLSEGGVFSYRNWGTWTRDSNASNGYCVIHAISLSEVKTWCGQRNDYRGCIYLPNKQDTTPPTISNVKITEISTTGYTIMCNVSDNIGIKEVKFPTWTTRVVNGTDQDDIVWGVGLLNNGVATYTVNIADHGNDADSSYRTHIYAYDNAGNSVSYPVPDITLAKVNKGVLQKLDENFECSIRCGNSNKALTVSGDNVVIADFKEGEDSQYWKFVSNGDGTYTILSRINNKCLDVNGAAIVNGTNIGVFESNNTNAQKWYVYKDDSSNIYLNPKNAPNSVLDIGGSNGNVHLWSFSDNNANQTFKLVEDAKLQLYEGYGRGFGTMNGRDVRVIEFDVTAKAEDKNSTLTVSTITDFNGKELKNEKIYKIDNVGINAFFYVIDRDHFNNADGDYTTTAVWRNKNGEILEQKTTTYTFVNYVKSYYVSLSVGEEMDIYEATGTIDDMKPIARFRPLSSNYNVHTGEIECISNDGIYKGKKAGRVYAFFHVLKSGEHVPVIIDVVDPNGENKDDGQDKIEQPENPTEPTIPDMPEYPMVSTETDKTTDAYQFSVKYENDKFYFTWNVIDSTATYKVEYSIIPTAGFLAETMYEVVPVGEGKMCYVVNAIPYNDNSPLYFRIKQEKANANPTYSDIVELNWITHKVTFMDGNKVVSEQNVYKWSNAKAPSLVKEGYELSWNGKFEDVTSDEIVYAVWTKKDKDVKEPTSGQTVAGKNLPRTGTQVTVGNGIYKVAKSTSSEREVTYVKPKNKKKTSVTIPATVKVNGYSYKVTSIASKAFKNNKKLKSVTVGKYVKQIGKEAFYNCKKLKKITVKSSVLKSVGKNAIKNINKKAVIKVPKKKLKVYKKLFKSTTGYKRSMKIKK